MYKKLKFAQIILVHHQFPHKKMREALKKIRGNIMREWHEKLTIVEELFYNFAEQDAEYYVTCYTFHFML